MIIMRVKFNPFASSLVQNVKWVRYYLVSVIHFLLQVIFLWILPVASWKFQTVYLHCDASVKNMRCTPFISGFSYSYKICTQTHVLGNWTVHVINEWNWNVIGFWYYVNGERLVALALAALSAGARVRVADHSRHNLRTWLKIVIQGKPRTLIDV